MSNEKIKKSINCIFLILAGSFLFAFSNPNVLVEKGFPLAAWIMHVPYFFLIKKSSLKSSWFYSGIYGITSVFFYAWWLYNYDPSCLIIALVIAFVGLAFCGLILKAIQNFFPKNYWLVWFLAICSFDYLRTLGFLGFHYGLAVYSQWNMNTLIQSLSIAGPFGVNAVIVFFSALVFAFISKLEDKRLLFHKMVSDNDHYDGATYINYVSENDRLMQQTSLVVPVVFSGVWFVLLISMLVFGNVNLKKQPDYKTINVAAIQHNDRPEAEGLESFRESLQALINLTDEALDINPDIDIVLWPETAVVPSIVYHYNVKENTDRKKLVTYLLNYLNSREPAFVVGNQHIQVNSDGSKKRYYNSALFFQKGKNAIPPQPQVYSKIHLVPFSESFPYEKFFPHVYKFLLEQARFFWTPGEEIKVFESDGLSFYTPICFENTFPDLCRKAYQQGARAFFAMANDSWAKSLTCQYEHMAMAKCRAVENHVPVVVSAVSGQTVVIAPDGRIQEMAVPFSKTYVVSKVPVVPQNQKSTIYNKIGDVFGYGMIFLFIVVLLIRSFIGIIGYISKRK